MMVESVHSTLGARSRVGALRGRTKSLHRLAAFVGGCALGQLYYGYLLKKIPFSERMCVALSLTSSLLLGIGNVVCAQLRCISLLTLPMYCGKSGRGVLKAVVLTYIIAGPITNMGLNAKEVVRVFACTTHLSHNLSRVKYAAVGKPFKTALLNMRAEISQVKDTVRSIRDVAIPIELELEGQNIVFRNQYVTNITNNNSEHGRKPEYRPPSNEDNQDIYQYVYRNKLEGRCESLMSRATAFCLGVMTTPSDMCKGTNQQDSAGGASWPRRLSELCDWRQAVGSDICDSSKWINPGLGEGYSEFKRAKNMLANNKEVSLQYQINTIRQLHDIQDAKETGDRVMHAFEEKYTIMHNVTVLVDVCVALLFLRIFTASVTYHDRYLTSIEHDNIYITSYFKRIDEKRRKKGKYNLLPLKKMERSKYVDVHSLTYKSTERDQLISHILKVLLEVVTATTFVMLDRLFYEALDVVRQHAETELPMDGNRDLEIQVDGTGTLAGMVRKILSHQNNAPKSAHAVTNRHCLPKPRLMPALYYVKIYGGYLWIVLLLYVNPYTMRLKRLICSYFYPRREKQRILHLYNDILKKRMKMQKTYRRKAVQTVRAHYLSGESLLSLRARFPRLLGWLEVLPAARTTCLICGETAPRTAHWNHGSPEEKWQSCSVAKCPFGYCTDCWQEVGARCLACDPSLADLSDMDSLTEDELRG